MEKPGSRIEDPVGSVAWLRRTEGRLNGRERVALLAGAVQGLREGFRLRHERLSKGRATGGLTRFDPPDTAMVRAARELVTRSAHPSMVNHCYRTAFWALTVLEQTGGLSAEELETTWVAALLHDVGLERPPARGDFSLGGVQELTRLAREIGWSDAQRSLASEAIASNLSSHVDAARLGRVAWAMNVGGVGELGFGPHRALMEPGALAELEARHPRAGFRATALRLIEEEAQRVPGGRFAFFRLPFYLLLR